MRERRCGLAYNRQFRASDMREGVKVIKIPSATGEKPDWPHDERKVRRDAAKVRRFEQRLKRLIEFENRPKQHSDLRFG